MTGKTNPLRESLATCDLPCTTCGYNLHGNESLICPECGHPFDPSERTRAPDTAWRIGLAAMLLNYAALAILSLQIFRGDWLIAIPSALFLLDASRRITRWRKTRRALAVQPDHVRQLRAGAWCIAAAASGLVLFIVLRYRN